MKKILLSLVALLALSFVGTSASAANHCIQKKPCGKAYSKPCLKVMAARYNKCRHSVAVAYKKCLTPYHRCLSGCRKGGIFNTRRMYCPTSCKLRYVNLNKRCLAISRTRYAACARAYNAVKARCVRIRYRLCRATTTNLRANCQKTNNANYQTCRKRRLMAVYYKKHCLGKYGSCTKRCRFLRASISEKKACNDACAKKNERILLRCKYLYDRQINADCRKARSAGNVRCLKLSTSHCRRDWRCSPCR